MQKICFRLKCTIRMVCTPVTVCEGSRFCYSLVKGVLYVSLSKPRVSVDMSLVCETNHVSGLYFIYNDLKRLMYYVIMDLLQKDLGLLTNLCLAFCFTSDDLLF
jgi:hypothetical protein